ncbi:DUF6382 domain-containing protein [Agathobacter sp.]
MNCNEIVYERKMTGSFMKLRCDGVKPLDEKILLKNNIPGFLSMEKCYVNNEGQYWYDISGVQSLEMRCQYNDIKLEFLEKLVVSICDRMELLENHLVGTECLLLEPQLIYINQAEEIYFTAYPAEMKTMYTTFQHLMEFMLTKLDHSDAEAIHIAYGIYEKTLNGNYSISDIRNAIIEERQKKAAEKPVDEVIAPISQPKAEPEEHVAENEPGIYDKIRIYIQEHLDIKLPELKKSAERTVDRQKASEKNEKVRKFKEKGFKEKGRKKKPVDAEDMIVRTASEPEPQRQIHPTVCLSDYREHPQGMLLYEGMERHNNIIIEKDSTRIGQGDDVDAVISKDTISHFHAVINRENKEFYLEDLNSTNGTFVNDEVLAYKEKKQLKSNDIIRFADVKFRFV